MINSFDEKVRRLSASLPREVHAKTSRRLARLDDIGISSFDSLFELIESPKAKVADRITASWLAGRLGSKKAAKALLKAYAEKNVRLQWEAAIALGLLRSKLAVGPLTKELVGKEDEQKRAAAAYALGLIGDERAESSLLSVLTRGNESSLVNSHVAEALAHFKSKQVVNHLIKALEESSVDVVFSSVYALGQIADKNAISALENFVSTTTKRFQKAKDEALRTLKYIRNSNI